MHSEPYSNEPMCGNCHPGFFCGVFGGIIWAVINGILSVYNIAYANDYEGKVMCWNATARAGTQYEEGLSQTVGVNHWMRVYGWQVTVESIVYILIVVFAMLRLCAQRGSCQKPAQCLAVINVIFCVCIIILVFFRFAWNIVGAVLIWRDCPDFSPQPVKDLCWASVIICYCGLSISIISAIVGINISVAGDR